MSDTYARLIALLDAQRATYRLIDHPPEGRTEIVSPMRGHPVAEAAKCIIVMIKIGKKITKFALAVVPGDARLDLGAIRTMMNATYVGFAPPDRAEALAGSVVGTVLPFSFAEELTVFADPGLMDHAELYFNAARLDRSVALKTEDYFRIAQPRIARIVERASL